MKQSVLFFAILFAMTSCLKDDNGNDPRRTSVEQYVTLLKSNSFSFWDVPIFEISDIPVLLKHARNEQKITIYTTPPWSSAFYDTISASLGMVILWTIEGTRLDVDHPSDTMIVVDGSDRVITQSEVADLYERWWTKNKGKTIAQLKEISPLEGTTFNWYNVSM